MIVGMFSTRPNPSRTESEYRATYPEHVAAQRRGREAFYDEYWIQVCSTVREGWFRRGEPYREDLTELFLAPAAG